MHRASSSPWSAISTIAARRSLFKAVLSVRASAGEAGVLQARDRFGCGTGLGSARIRRGATSSRHRHVAPHDRAGARCAASIRISWSANWSRGPARASEIPAQYELALATDVLVYFGDLAPVLREAERVLAPGGLLAFTAETHAGDGVVLGAGLRYAHGAPYVRAAIEAAGLTLSQLEAAVVAHRGRCAGARTCRGRDKSIDRSADLDRTMRDGLTCSGVPSPDRRSLHA